MHNTPFGPVRKDACPHEERAQNESPKAIFRIFPLLYLPLPPLSTPTLDNAPGRGYNVICKSIPSHTGGDQKGGDPTFMKILILSMTAGEGHNSAARAMREYFAAKGADCEVVDTYGYISPAISNSINKSYLWITKRAKRAYGLGYEIAEKRTPPKLTEITPAQVLNLPITMEVRQCIDAAAPDVVVFTHVFVGMMLDTLKQTGKIRVPTVGILTDFIFHPFWEDATDNDYVVIPAESLKHQGRRKGFREEQLLPFGIPISPRFAETTDKAAARASLGLDPTLPTVLLMGGSMGFGRMVDFVTALDRLSLGTDFQMIAVCGSNEKMREKIDSLKGDLRHPILNLGFALNVDRLMDASDCIVTKPGGLTTSEALAKRLPMVIVNPIPGQEMRNAEFLLNSGTAVSANNMCGVEELVLELLTNPIRRTAMEQCIETLRRPNATRDVCEFVMELARTHGNR